MPLLCDECLGFLDGELGLPRMEPTSLVLEHDDARTRLG
jgi:hypothetical protein